MRIRLRVPKDDAEKPGGLRGWFDGLFSPADAPTLAPAPAVPPAKPDKRWLSRANSRYFVAGRLCVKRSGAWESDYLFDVVAAGQTQQIRVVLPETDVALWEKARKQRMPEALRYRLVRETLEALLDLERFPAAIHVNPLEIENANL
jgi:hypothetical protein